MNSGIVTLDMHGKNCFQAQTAIDAALRRSRGVYRLTVIHGFNGGSALRDMIRERYSRHAAVLRLEEDGPGRTTLVLREF